MFLLAIKHEIQSVIAVTPVLIVYQLGVTHLAIDLNLNCLHRSASNPFFLCFKPAMHPYITFCERVHVFSAGEEWTENLETYESSFYKRTLDNEIYIFTAPLFNGEFSGRVGVCLCACDFSTPEHLQCGLALSQSHKLCLDVIPTPRPLISLSLSCSFSHRAHPQPSPPHPRPVHFLLSPLISLADRADLERDVSVFIVTLDWINTCTGFMNSTPSTQAA